MRIPTTIEDAIWKAERLFPHLQKWKPQAPNQGGQNFTLIYGDQVVRLPRNETCLAELKKEADILTRLEGRDLGAKIPRLLEFDDDNHAIIISRVQGKPLNAFSLSAMKNSELEDIGMQLGTFLHQLHGALDIDLTPEKYAQQEKAYHARILLRAHGADVAEAAKISPDRLREVDSDYLRNFGRIEDHVVQLHGDVSYGNILYDAAARKISVVDFMGARKGYRHEDFMFLGGFPQIVQDQCLDIYGLLSKKPIDPELIKLSRDAKSVCRIIEGGTPLDRQPYLHKDYG